MESINQITNQLADMYRYFNKALDAELPDNVVFALIPNRTSRGRYYGWFAKTRWVHNTDKLHEINIAPDYLNRSVDDIAETVIHEIVHLKNAILGIKDCTPSQYHNKAFKKQAEEYGLVVNRMRNKGYALTSLGEKAKEIVDRYKKEKLNGTNPFIIHRITDVKPPRISFKKNVSIDKDLCDQVLDKCGGKISQAVDSILRDWVVANG